jgi:HEAT repeat protein
MKRWLLISAAVALLVTGLLFVNFLSTPANITYRGKSVRALIVDLNATIPTKRVDALNRLIQMNQEAVPYLVAAVEEQNSRLFKSYYKFRLSAWLPHWLASALPPPQGRDTILCNAIFILGQIGPNARTAVPALLKLLQDCNGGLRIATVATLGLIGPDARAAIPALASVFQESDDMTRLSIVSALIRIGDPDREAAGTLSKLAHELRGKRHVPAAMALWLVYGEPQPALDMLRTREDIVDWENFCIAADFLGTIGPEAKPAIPILVEAFNDKREMIRECAAKALQRIDPKATPRQAISSE